MLVNKSVFLISLSLLTMIKSWYNGFVESTCFARMKYPTLRSSEFRMTYDEYDKQIVIRNVILAVLSVTIGS